MRSNCSPRRSSGMLSHTPVRINPGQTALTRIGASSTAKPRVRCSTAPAIAVLRAEPLLGRCAIIPSVNVIDPPCGGAMSAFDDCKSTPEAYGEIGPGALEVHVDDCSASRFPIARGKHQMVNMTKLIERRSDGVLAGHIHRHAGGAFREPLDRPLDLCRIARRDNDFGVLFQGQFGDGEADPRRAPDHHDALRPQTHECTSTYSAAFSTAPA